MSFSSKKVKDLESISKLKSNNGVYAVLGNHDYVHLPKLKKLELTANNIAKALQELNVNVLRNQSTLINIGDSKINLIGFDSFKTKKINVNKAFSNVNNEHPKIIEIGVIKLIFSIININISKKLLFNIFSNDK